MQLIKYTLLSVILSFSTITTAENATAGNTATEPASPAASNGKINRSELQARIDELNDNISEQKEEKKICKKKLDDLSPLFLPFEGSKPEINKVEQDKLFADYARTRNYNILSQLSQLCYSEVFALQDGLSTQERSPEVQSLISTVSQKITAALGNIDYYSIEVSKVKEIYSQENAEKLFNDIRAVLTAFKKNLTDKIEKADEELKKLNAEKFSYQEQMESKTDTTETIFKWGFPVFIIFILSLYLTPLFLYRNRKKKAEQESAIDKEETGIYSSIYGTGLITEIITVFLLTSTILLLGLTDKINSEILGTLIGGISGYVLGKTFKGGNSGGN